VPHPSLRVYGTSPSPWAEDSPLLIVVAPPHLSLSQPFVVKKPRRGYASLSSETNHELTPPNSLRIQEPWAYALDELLGGHVGARIQVPKGDDENVASGDTCANESGTRYMVRHIRIERRAAADERRGGLVTGFVFERIDTVLGAGN
jgi:hypothetical protein